MRLFTGLALEYPVRRNLELMLEHFRPLAAIDWAPPDNFHITTHFIGEWPEARLEELKAALSSAKLSSPELKMRIRGFGWYPNPHQPRVFFAGVKTEQPLYDLATLLREVCNKLGVPMEDRPYSPHLTLARIRPKGGERINLTPLRQAVAQLPSDDFGESRAAKFLLYKSEAKVYNVIGEFPL